MICMHAFISNVAVWDQPHVNTLGCQALFSLVVSVHGYEACSPGFDSRWVQGRAVTIGGEPVPGCSTIHPGCCGTQPCQTAGRVCGGLCMKPRQEAGLKRGSSVAVWDQPHVNTLGCV